MRTLPEFDNSFRSIVVQPAVTVGALILVALAIGLLGSWWVRGSLQVAWPKVVFWGVMLPWILASLWLV
ncbi:hypothetical protein [Ottowia sp.]|uniref:hypothetical protein n=1 Tax=Ottowia sp. TaxID=1898956 RepID=UPI0039E5C39F